ncbi:hypothetical protein LTR84_004057 [Exophiala bonariae]|uniref:Aflatoxin regulatory protein domain-containing protein n=1 Tax=Exophiala bonariae TaxID=1690606 RepID=A0AAV9N6E0_9EURO|nr:hypothetical protein LTR84_004057 [Exophiala bonariae]
MSQCLKRKVICPGYKRDLRWSDKHEVFSTGRWEDASAQDVPTSLSVNALATRTPEMPDEAFHPSLERQQAQMLPAQSLGSVTDAASSSQTPPQPVDSSTSTTFPATGDKFISYEDRSSTDIFREDLREWLASHEPITLLEQQDWTWTLNGLPLSCDEPSTLVNTLDCRVAAAPQGSELNQSLVQYFFDNLCCIHTVLDDTAERFKALVHRYLTSSPLLHKSIVCMSAAHCFQDDESMLPMCLECHSAAVRSLSVAVFEIETVIEESSDSPRNAALAENNMLRKLEETLLASIILGFCAVSAVVLFDE